ncbi:nuclear transport factor 2 family protein [Nocardia gipuzkoensis]
MSSAGKDEPATNPAAGQQFSDIEAIKQLKARYCRHLDAKDWQTWREVFTDDFVSDTTESGGPVIIGADAFVEFLRTQLGKPGRRTVHHVHAPEIELVAPAAARGIWAMQDVVRLAPGLTLLGYGHYHETYAKIDGSWYIATSKLTRLREDLVTPVFSFRLPAWLRDAAGAAVKRKHQK